MHPALAIMWLLIFSLLAPRLSWVLLLSISVGMLFYCPRRRRVFLGSLFWRVRWLVVSLFLVLAWTAPGKIVWPVFGAWSPTEPGLEIALRQVTQLLTFMIVWFVLLSRYEAHSLASGLYFLMWPFRLLGIDTHQFCIRLAITFSLLSNEISKSLRVSKSHHLSIEYLASFFVKPNREPQQPIIWAPQPLTPLGVFYLLISILLGCLLFWRVNGL